MSAVLIDARIRRAFTLIELLVVIAIIGLLSSIVLASLNTARDKGKRAGVETAMHQVFLKMSECIISNQGQNPYCYGTVGSHTSSYSCGGGGGAIPVVGTAICGLGPYPTASGWTDTDWPDLTQYGYVYAAYAYGNTKTGAFDFEIKTSSGSDYYCCTQNGCAHLTGDSGNGTTNTCRTNAGL